MSEDAQEMLTRAFAQLGATADQAPVMAAQLLKRARQLAVERSIPETAALAELLAKVTAGRQGDYGAEPDPPEEGAKRDCD